MNTYHPREGWTPNNGKDYYDYDLGEEIDYMNANKRGKCENTLTYPYRVEGKEADGKKSVRCYEKPGRKRKN